jgi:enoyl-CoA hydratase
MSNVLLIKEGNTAIIKFNRQEKLNALTMPIIYELTKMLNDLNVDDSVRGIIITGEGKSFSAGMDINVLKEQDPVSARKMITDLHNLIKAVRFNSKPIVCAVNGYCFGGAFELMICCDLSIAVQTAKFSMAEVNVGVPSVIEAALFPFIIGFTRAKDILLTGRTIDAPEAFQMGLINKVVPSETLIDEAKTMLKEVIKNSAWVVRLQKELMNRWLEAAGFEQAIKTGIDYFAYSFVDEGTKKALSSALKKNEHSCNKQNFTSK